MKLDEEMRGKVQEVIAEMAGAEEFDRAAEIQELLRAHYPSIGQGALNVSINIALINFVVEQVLHDATFDDDNDSRGSALRELLEYLAAWQQQYAIARAVLREMPGTFAGTPEQVEAMMEIFQKGGHDA
jgi:hypothetical protein